MWTKKFAFGSFLMTNSGLYKGVWLPQNTVTLLSDHFLKFQEWMIFNCLKLITICIAFISFWIINYYLFRFIIFSCISGFLSCVKCRVLQIFTLFLYQKTWLLFSSQNKVFWWKWLEQYLSLNNKSWTWLISKKLHKNYRCTSTSWRIAKFFKFLF